MFTNLLFFITLAQVYQTIEIPDDMKIDNLGQCIIKMNALYRDMPISTIEEMKLVEDSDKLNWDSDCKIIYKE